MLSFPKSCIEVFCEILIVNSVLIIVFKLLDFLTYHTPVYSLRKYSTHLSSK